MSRKHKKKLHEKMTLERSVPNQNDASPIKKEAVPANQGNINPQPTSNAQVNSSRRMEELSQPNQKRQQARAKWKFRLEIGTAVFLGITVIINWLIWLEMKETTRATKSSADAAAAATSAWIVAEQWTYNGTENDRANFKVVFKNIGKIPATDSKAGWEFSFMPTKDLKWVPKFEAYQCPKAGVRPGIMPPDGTSENKISSPPLTAEQTKLLTDRIGRVFIHGCVRYRDILSPEKERTTEFAMIYPSINDDVGDRLTIYDPYTRMK